MTVKEITLLSSEEHVKYEPIIPDIKGYRWWLRSPGYYQNYVVFVFAGDDVIMLGYNVNDAFGAVRPALLINLDTSDSKFWYKPEKLIGTKIKYGNYWWTILDTEYGELYILCDDIIAYRRFDPNSNDWDKSELKQWLETEGLKLITTRGDDNNDS